MILLLLLVSSLLQASEPALSPLSLTTPTQKELQTFLTPPPTVSTLTDFQPTSSSPFLSLSEEAAVAVLSTLPEEKKLPEITSQVFYVQNPITTRFSKEEFQAACEVSKHNPEVVTRLLHFLSFIKQQEDRQDVLTWLQKTELVNPTQLCVCLNHVDTYNTFIQAYNTKKSVSFYTTPSIKFKESTEADQSFLKNLFDPQFNQASLLIKKIENYTHDNFLKQYMGYYRVLKK